VIDTRHGRRRRECANGHRFRTVEITYAHYDYVIVQRRMREARAVLRQKGYLK